MDPLERVEFVLAAVSRALGVSEREAARMIRRIDNERRGHVQGRTGRDRAREITSLVNAGGWSVGEFVERKLPLLGLPEDLRSLVRRGRLAPTKALVLGRIAEAEHRRAKTQEVISRRISLRTLRESAHAKMKFAGQEELQGEFDWIARELTRHLGLRVRLSPTDVRIEYSEPEQLSGLLERLGLEL